LKRVWGRWYKQGGPGVCAMRARPAAACGRGALFVSSEPKRAGSRLVIAIWSELEGVCAVKPSILDAIRPSDKHPEQRRWA
jgi:hypothetical protein